MRPAPSPAKPQNSKLRVSPGMLRQAHSSAEAERPQSPAESSDQLQRACQLLRQHPHLVANVLEQLETSLQIVPASPSRVAPPAPSPEAVGSVAPSALPADGAGADAGTGKETGPPALAEATSAQVRPKPQKPRARKPVKANPELAGNPAFEAFHALGWPGTAWCGQMRPLRPSFGGC